MAGSDSRFSEAGALMDLLADPDAPLRRHRFGASTGTNGLIEELEALRDVGVRHVGLHFRRNGRPLDETLEEIAEMVLPRFHDRVAVPA